jgi:hypothetical protein
LKPNVPAVLSRTAPELRIEPAVIETTETTLAPGPVQVPDGVRVYVTIPVGLKAVLIAKLAWSITLWPALTGPDGIRLVRTVGLALPTLKDSHDGLELVELV